MLNGLVLALILVGFYYNSYRYPFQINSTDTSPTYSDTPVSLSIGKYVIMGALLAAAVLWRATQRSEVRIGNPAYTVAYLYLAGLPILTGVALQRVEFIEIGFFFLVPLFLLWFSGWRLPYRSVNRAVVIATYVAIAVEFIQIVLFIAFGRLPALAHRDSISVRFGSFLDDPNGFGLLISWMVPFAWVAFRGMKRGVVVLLLLGSLVLTQSLTAIGAFCVVAIGCVLRAITQRIQSAFAALVALTGFVIVVGSLAYIFREPIAAAYSLFLLTKQGSIGAHAESAFALRDLGFINLAGLEPLGGRREESGYVNMLTNFGLLYMALYFAVGVIAIGRYFSILRSTTASKQARTFAAGALGMLVAVYVANANLPVLEVFPINLFGALLVGLATAGLVDRDRSATQDLVPNINENLS